MLGKMIVNITTGMAAVFESPGSCLESEKNIILQAF
jgi:hypothetical protein